jgi:hypothetical protein
VSMVRFATICDHKPCRERSQEYTSWPSCIYCGLDTCPAHMRPGTDDADETGYRCICIECEVALPQTEPEPIRLGERTITLRETPGERD